MCRGGICSILRVHRLGGVSCSRATQLSVHWLGEKRKVYDVRFKLNHFPNAVFMMINGKKVLNALISRLCVVRAAVDQIHHCPCGETCK